MNIDFSDVHELKKRLLPALKLRKRELLKNKIIISEEELWDYFVANYWKCASNLSLYEMVDNILNEDIFNEKDENL